MGFVTMSDTTALRKKATLFRRIASITTSGGSIADRILLHLAERLEHEATASEWKSDPNSRHDADRRPVLRPLQPG